MFHELTVAKEAVRLAAQLCDNVQRSQDLATLEKGDKSPVTAADFGAQALVCRALATAFPHDPVMGEEGAAALREDAALCERVVSELARVGVAASSSEVCTWIDRGGSRSYAPRFWVLDPIDGTQGFLRGAHYAVALALVVEGDLKLSAVACPRLAFSHDSPGGGVLFFASRGEGAYQAPLDSSQKPQPLRVSNRQAHLALLCQSVNPLHSDQESAARVMAHLGNSIPSQRLDSLAKYGIVARGDADLYLRLPTGAGRAENIWDHASGVLLVEEAGGVVSDARGRRLDLRQGATLSENEGVIASNGRFHEEIVAAYQRATDSS